MNALDVLNGSSDTPTTGQVWMGTGSGKKELKFPKGAKANMPTDTMSVVDAKNMYYTDANFRASWDGVLRANGMGDAAGSSKAVTLYEMAVDDSARYFNNSGGTWKVTPAQALGFYAKGQGKTGGTGVSVSKYLYQPEEVQNLINTTVTNFLGRKATADEQRQFYDVIKKMIDEGTVTTTKVVGGKTISTTTPGYSAEKAKATIEKSLTEQAPQDVQEKQSLDFMGLLNKWSK
jgi:hypothetical protein